MSFINQNQLTINNLLFLINEFLGMKSSKKEHGKQVEGKLKLVSQHASFFELVYQLIIQVPSLSQQQLFIASLLLRDKFRYQFDKYNDQQAILSLESMLKQIIKKLPNTINDTFSANISVCMICLYIKRAEKLKEQYHQSGILQYFQGFTDQTTSPDYFYKALQYAPQEIFSSKIVMDEVKKDRIRAYIRYSQFEVLKHLNSVAVNLWENKIIKKKHLFSALQNWISVGYKEALFHDLPNHFLVQKLFQNCLNSAVSSQAADCLRAIIKKLKVATKDDYLFSFLGNGVFKLVDSITLHLKQFGQSPQANEAIQVVTDFGLLATQFFIGHFNPDVKKFLQSTIQYMRTPDLDVYPNLVDFWQCFINDVHKSKALNAQFVALFKDAYASVCFMTTWKLEMIQRMNQISETNLGQFYKEAQDIAERRDNSEDFFQVLSLAFGQENYLAFVLSCITQLPKSQPETFYPFLESYLNSLKNSLNKIQSVSQSVKILVSSYAELQDLTAVKNAYLTLFKSLMTIKQPNTQIKGQFIKHLFAVVASGLNDQKLQKKSQKAFSKGCQQNPQIVLVYIDDFLNLLKLHQGNQQIVQGLMHVLSSNAEVMQKYLPTILQIEYQIFSEAPNSLKKRAAYFSLFALFKILNNYKQKDYFADIIVEFTKMIWPLLLSTLAQPKDMIFDQDPEIQRAVKLIKFIMRCLKDNFIQFLQSLFTTILQAYQKYPICSFIYALEVAITVFYNNGALANYLRDLYKNFCKVTYIHLQTAQNVQDYQLLIDDFIGMNKRFFIYNSKIVLQSGQLPSLIATCMNISNIIDVPRVSKSAYDFFQTIFKVYWSDDFINKYNQNQDVDKFSKDMNSTHLYLQLKQFILPKLAEIIIKMIKHLQKVPLQSTAEIIMDAIISEIKGFPAQNPSIWTSILENISQQVLTNSQKTEIYQNLSRVGSSNIQQSRDAASSTDRLLYIMNKRFINNEKRKI